MEYKTDDYSKHRMRSVSTDNAQRKPHVKHLRGSHNTQRVSDELEELFTVKVDESRKDDGVDCRDSKHDLVQKHFLRSSRHRLNLSCEEPDKLVFNSEHDKHRSHGLIDKLSKLDLMGKIGKRGRMSSEHSIDDNFYGGEMRARTFSMPTRNTVNKPHIQHLRRSHMCLNTEPELESYHVRSFEISSKGLLVKGTDSIMARSSNNMFCSIDSLQMSANLSRGSSTQSGGSSIYNTSPLTPITYSVVVSGVMGVGKTALTQQFMTSEYLGGFDTSFGEQESHNLLCSSSCPHDCSDMYLNDLRESFIH